MTTSVAYCMRCEQTAVPCACDQVPNAPRGPLRVCEVCGEYTYALRGQCPHRRPYCGRCGAGADEPDCCTPQREGRLIVVPGAAKSCGCLLGEDCGCGRWL